MPDAAVFVVELLMAEMEFLARADEVDEVA